jgi:hypothetical protein
LTIEENQENGDTASETQHNRDYRIGIPILQIRNQENGNTKEYNHGTLVVEEELEVSLKRLSEDCEDLVGVRMF